MFEKGIYITNRTYINATGASAKSKKCVMGGERVSRRTSIRRFSWTKSICDASLIELATPLVTAPACELSQVWKQAVVVPHKKSAKSEQPSDTISHLPVLSKVIERSAHVQLTEYLNSKKFISPYQSRNQ